MKNQRVDEKIAWEIAFVFGSSKSIHTLTLSTAQRDRLLKTLPTKVGFSVRSELEVLSQYIRHSDILHMQDVWSHRGPGGVRPFMLLDEIDRYGRELIPLLTDQEATTKVAILDIVEAQYGPKTAKLAGLEKLKKNSSLIFAGILIGSSVNSELYRHGSQVHIDLRKHRVGLRA